MMKTARINGFVKNGNARPLKVLISSTEFSPKWIWLDITRHDECHLAAIAGTSDTHLTDNVLHLIENLFYYFLEILMNRFVVSLTLCALASSANAAIDLRARISGPAQYSVDTPAQYQIVVDNLGSTQQRSAAVTVSLPMGAKASGHPSNCSTSSKYLFKCTLGNFAPGALSVIYFTLESPAPVVNWPLMAQASGLDREYATGNNQQKISLTLSAPAQNDVSIVGPTNARTDACTFSINSPVNFALCGSSSINGYDLILDAGGTVIRGNAPIGTWYQPSPDLLWVDIDDGAGGHSVEYRGHAISPRCFEGEGIFPNSPNYHVAYHTCLMP